MITLHVFLRICSIYVKCLQTNDLYVPEIDQRKNISLNSVYKAYMDTISRHYIKVQTRIVNINVSFGIDNSKTSENVYCNVYFLTKSKQSEIVEYIGKIRIP